MGGTKHKRSKKGRVQFTAQYNWATLVGHAIGHMHKWMLGSRNNTRL